ncbi:MAG: 1,4-alpha-glucan branching enzyme, partial [Firmicutes bacterium]|nr:1,4-alpha-glucan branching enzyme [Bacillota bacterium]
MTASFHSFDPDAFLQGRCLDVGAWFGPHLIPGEGLRIRAFLPRAESAELRQGGASLGLFTRVHPEGLFEIHLPDQLQVPDYRIRVTGWGEITDWEDPYRFGPVLGELDHYLHAEGTHLRSYHHMGAHGAQRQGVEGATF